jgi:hypothetical protein
MNLQGVHDILQSSDVSHTEVVNDFDLAEEDFQQDVRDSVPEEENAAMPNHEYDTRSNSLNPS